MKDAHTAESNEKSIFNYPVMTDSIYNFTETHRTFHVFQITQKISFESGQIHREGAQCAETNEKSIFWILAAVEFVIKIDRKLTDFEYKIDRISTEKSHNRFFIRFSTPCIFHADKKM